MRRQFKVSFYLRSNYENKEGKSPIMLRIFLNREMANLGTTKLFVKKSMWNNSTSRMKGRTAEALTLNASLDSLSTSLYEMFGKMKEEEDLTVERLKQVYNEETGLVKFRNCHWYTNLEHGRRYEELKLMTIEENLRYSRHKEIKGKSFEVAYPRYDNYDAIEVGFTDAIPSNYDGVMGVPISFLDKYCPEQFEIIGSFNNSSVDTKANEGSVPSIDTPTIINGVEKLWNGPVVNKQPLYKRIAIRSRQADLSVAGANEA